MEVVVTCVVWEVIKKGESQKRREGPKKEEKHVVRKRVAVVKKRKNVVTQDAKRKSLDAVKLKEELEEGVKNIQNPSFYHLLVKYPYYILTYNNI